MMNKEIMEWAFSQKISAAGIKLSLLSIAKNSDDKGYCKVSFDQLMSDCSNNQAALEKQILKLGSLKLIEIIEFDYEKKTLEYQLNVKNVF